MEYCLDRNHNEEARYWALARPEQYSLNGKETQRQKRGTFKSSVILSTQ